jgi:uncharacterized protein (DUF2384 family)
MKKAEWENYVEVIPDVDTDEKDVKKLLDLVGDRGMVKVIYFHFGNTAVSWLDKPVPALEQKKPRECLESEEGVNLLKETLMKMPC